MARLKFFLSLFSILITSALFAQELGDTKTLNWYPVQKFSLTDQHAVYQLYFEGATQLGSDHEIPYYSERIRIAFPNARISATLRDQVFEEIDDPNLGKVNNLESISNEIIVNAAVAVDRKIPFALVSFIPLRKNPSSGALEKLVSFRIELDVKEDFSMSLTRPYFRKSSSVLSSGNWYKIAVNQTGVHRITYNELASMGIPVSAIDPRNIRIYGNGAGMLPERVSNFRYDDLTENAIFVSGEQDGSFDAGDFVLFYGEGPHVWNYNQISSRYNHVINIYSEFTYYFITTDLGPGKRIS